MVVVSPCAACKILRRKCVESCILAPYFPPSEPLKFATAHKIFGASNIIKFLQELPECERADAVSSMAYEANMRIKDPVYGCAGVICHLHRQVNELQVQLARTQAELVSAQCQNAQLTLFCMDVARSQQFLPVEQKTESSNADDTPFMNGNFMNGNTAFPPWGMDVARWQQFLPVEQKSESINAEAEDTPFMVENFMDSDMAFPLWDI